MSSGHDTVREACGLGDNRPGSESAERSHSNSSKLYGRCGDTRHISAHELLEPKQLFVAMSIRTDLLLPAKACIEVVANNCLEIWW